MVAVARVGLVLLLCCGHMAANTHRMVTYSADHPIAGSLKPLSIASTVEVIAGRRTSIIELINEIIEPHTVGEKQQFFASLLSRRIEVAQESRLIN